MARHDVCFKGRGIDHHILWLLLVFDLHMHIEMILSKL
jgi:hypothetical protein